MQPIFALVPCATVLSILTDTGDSCLVELISFDIDGTLEVGEPPGIITMAMVRKASQVGYLIGSCSDRPIVYQ